MGMMVKRSKEWGTGGGPGCGKTKDEDKERAANQDKLIYKLSLLMKPR
jgi:hypothetical protein